MLSRRLVVVAALFVGVVACEAKPAALTVGDAAAMPSAAPLRAALDTTCSADEDCVPAPGCCPAPCTELVINRRSLEQANAQNAKTCPAVRNCVSAGGCRTHAYLCVRKSCKLVYEDSPDYHAR